MEKGAGVARLNVRGVERAAAHGQDVLDPADNVELPLLLGQLTSAPLLLDDGAGPRAPLGDGGGDEKRVEQQLRLRLDGRGAARELQDQDGRQRAASLWRKGRTAGSYARAGRGSVVAIYGEAQVGRLAVEACLRRCGRRRRLGVELVLLSCDHHGRGPRAQRRQLGPLLRLWQVVEATCARAVARERQARPVEYRHTEGPGTHLAECRKFQSTARVQLCHLLRVRRWHASGKKSREVCWNGRAGAGPASQPNW